MADEDPIDRELQAFYRWEREKSAQHYPVSEEDWQRFRNWRGRGSKGARTAPRRFGDVWNLRYFLTLRPALVMISLASLVLLFSLRPRVEHWEPWAQAGGAKGSATNGVEIRKIMDAPLRLAPNFRKKTVECTFAAVGSFAGTLTEAPDLNTFADPSRRYYRMNELSGKAFNGESLTARGVLEIDGAALADRSVVNLRFSQVEKAVLTLQLKLRSAGPEFQVVRILSK